MRRAMVSSRTGAMEYERMNLLRPAIVYDLLLEVWHVLAAEILSDAKSSRSSGSDDHPCMSSKAEKFCSSEKCDESFFCSPVRYVIGCMWACTQCTVMCWNG